jgi:hypothetical protein
MPLAAAATIGVIAIGILQLTPQDQSLVLSDERVTAVRRGTEAQKPAPVIGKTADDAAKERDASAGVRSDAADFRQKKKQEAKPAASGSERAASSLSPPTAPVERENEIAAGKLAARAPEPQPFPAATESRKENSADMKRDRPRGGAASNAKNELGQAPMATTEAATTANVEERPVPRKDVADDGPQRAAAVTDKAAASAQSARPASTSDGAASSFAATPPPLARDAGLARNEAPAQASSGASPSRMLAKKAASLDELRAQARDPDAWIARIRKLRDEGNTAEALRELREFRNLVPDADQRLPSDLLAWANTVKP